MTDNLSNARKEGDYPVPARGLQFLPEIDAGLARQQYTIAKRLLVRSSLGITAVREVPEGSPEIIEVDSGPVLAGLGPAASGFGIAACAINGDLETARQLAGTAVVLGLPIYSRGELCYTIMPTVGQAVILFGKTLLLPQDKHP